MSSLVKRSASTLLLSIFLVACDGEVEVSGPFGIGEAVNQQEISAWDIDVGPDGKGLPAGSGTAQQGEPIYLAKCAACHGDFAEGVGRFPALSGGEGSLNSDRPTKTVGSYWPYATTLWDYINRAMPFGNAQSLSADEVYALTAYILSMNNLIADDKVLNAKSLPKVKMPNRNGFIVASGSDIKVDACMKDCTDKVNVVSRAMKKAAEVTE